MSISRAKGLNTHSVSCTLRQIGVPSYDNDNRCATTTTCTKQRFNRTPRLGVATRAELWPPNRRKNKPKKCLLLRNSLTSIGPSVFQNSTNISWKLKATALKIIKLSRTSHKGTGGSRGIAPFSLNIGARWRKRSRSGFGLFTPGKTVYQDLS